MAPSSGQLTPSTRFEKMAARKPLTKLQKLALFELLESSSSSDDEEEFAVLAYYLEKHKVKKTNEFLEEINAYDDDTFRQNFRLSRSSFNKLVKMFGQSPFMPKNFQGRKPVSPQVHILIFLLFAGQKRCSRSVSELLEVTVSSFNRCLLRVLDFFNRIKPHFIQMPRTPQLKAEIAEKFRSIAKFPNVIGCIDCSYIPIRTPAVNQHPIALTLQGVCDADGKFLDVETGFSSQIHDSRVFKSSELYPRMSEICEPDNTYHLLGDPDYALSATLLKPFPDTGCLTLPQKRLETQQQHELYIHWSTHKLIEIGSCFLHLFPCVRSSCHCKYNKSLAHTRAKIDTAFGLLKGRFKQLTKLDFHTMKKQSDFIVACCVLHNLCLEWNEAELESQEDEGQIEEQDQFEDTTPEDKEMGEAKRRRIVTTVFS